MIGHETNMSVQTIVKIRLHRLDSFAREVCNVQWMNKMIISKRGIFTLKVFKLRNCYLFHNVLDVFKREIYDFSMKSPVLGQLTGGNTYSYFRI